MLDVSYWIIKVLYIFDLCQLFSCCYDKTPNKKRLILAHNSGVEAGASWRGGHGNRSGRCPSHCSVAGSGVTRKRGQAGSLSTGPRKVPQPSQTVPPAGDQMPQHMSLRGPFLPRPAGGLSSEPQLSMAIECMLACSDAELQFRARDSLKLAILLQTPRG